MDRPRPPEPGQPAEGEFPPDPVYRLCRAVLHGDKDLDDTIRLVKDLLRQLEGWLERLLERREAQHRRLDRELDP